MQCFAFVSYVIKIRVAELNENRVPFREKLTQKFVVGSVVIFMQGFVSAWLCIGVD